MALGVAKSTSPTKPAAASARTAGMRSAAGAAAPHSAQLVDAFGSGGSVDDSDSGGDLGGDEDAEIELTELEDHEHEALENMRR